MTSYLGIQPYPQGGLSVRRRGVPQVDPAYSTSGHTLAVLLTEAKARLRVDTTDEDSDITNMLNAAIGYCQKYTNRQFIRAGYILTLDDFPPGPIELDGAPLSSVTSVKYVNESGTLTTWTASLYVVDTAFEPGRIRPAYGEDWPSIREPSAAVQVTYVCGYGTTSTTIPEDIRSAIMLLVTEQYRRQEPVEMAASRLGIAFEGLLDHFIVYRAGAA